MSRIDDEFERKKQRQAARQQARTQRFASHRALVRSVPTALGLLATAISVQIEEFNLRPKTTPKVGLRMTEDRIEIYHVGCVPSILDVEIEPKQRKSIIYRVPDQIDANERHEGEFIVELDEDGNPYLCRIEAPSGSLGRTVRMSYEEGSQLLFRFILFG